MTMRLMGMLAETPIHAGTGRSVGVVDLPVAREAATDYPVVVGSSMKGALRSKATGMNVVDENWVQHVFGAPEKGAGNILVSEARLLLLPVRSLTGAYRWLTCPHIIERYQRDVMRSGDTAGASKAGNTAGLSVDPGCVLTKGKGDDKLFLEEREFTIKGAPPKQVLDDLGTLVRHPTTRQRLANQVALLNDDDFSWFVRYGLQIQARNVLDERKRSENLWYEECLPPDTLMYATVADRDVNPEEEDANPLSTLFPDSDPYLQVGGNETVGQGWFCIALPDAPAEDGS